MACTDCIHLDNGCQWCGHCFGSVFSYGGVNYIHNSPLSLLFSSIFLRSNFFLIKCNACTFETCCARIEMTQARTSIPHTHAHAQRWRQRRINVCRLVWRHTRVVFKGDDYGSVLSGQRSMAPLFFFFKKGTRSNVFCFCLILRRVC